LLLSGGLTIHNVRDRSCFHETTSADIYRQFDSAAAQAVQVRDVSGSYPSSPSLVIACVLIYRWSTIATWTSGGRNITERRRDLVLSSLIDVYYFSHRNG